MTLSSRDGLQDVADALKIHKILQSAKLLAVEYRGLTGRPLGITGEIAEAEAVRLMKVELCPPREA